MPLQMTAGIKKTPILALPEGKRSPTVATTAHYAKP